MALWRIIPVACLAAAAQAATIDGRVVERQSRNPIASAEVRIRKPGAPSILADLETDGNGRFHAPDLPPGDYQIEILKPNFLIATVQTHAPGPSIAVQLIHFGVVSGLVVDEQGRPTRGARVFAMPFDPSLARSEAMTDENGKFRLFRLVPGQYTVAVSSGTHFVSYPDDAHPRVFAVTAGEEFPGISFTLLPGAAFSVSGSVRSAKASDSFGVALIARDRPSVSIAQMRTDAGGKFHFEGIPPGSYDVIAAGPSNAWGAREVLVNPGALFGRLPIEIAGQDIADLSVPVSEGRSAVVVLADNQCSPDAEISLLPIEDLGVRSALRAPAERNRPQTLSNLAPGKYRAVLMNGGDCYQSGLASVDVTQGNLTEPVAVHTTLAGSIAGKVTGADKPSDMEVSLIAVATEGQPVQIVYPDAEGRFTFPKLRPGPYRITARSSVVEVNVPGGGAVTAEIQLPPPQ